MIGGRAIKCAGHQGAAVWPRKREGTSYSIAEQAAKIPELHIMLQATPFHFTREMLICDFSVMYAGVERTSLTANPSPECLQEVRIDIQTAVQIRFRDISR